jgi:hypothetical protein
MSSGSPTFPVEVLYFNKPFPELTTSPLIDHEFSELWRSTDLEFAVMSISEFGVGFPEVVREMSSAARAEKGERASTAQIVNRILFMVVVWVL